MSFLNYHHLAYFRVVAEELNLTRAAARLNLSPPAVSIQLRQLEENLGHALFERTPAGLRLTEAGRLALDYANTIGRAGEELLDVMKHRPLTGRSILRVGVVATLSRNFLLAFLRPALSREGLEIVTRTAPFRDLLDLLDAHQVDLLLSNQPVRRDAAHPWHNHLLEEQPVALVAAPEWKTRRLRFPRDFNDIPLLLPSHESNVREGFDRLLSGAGIHPRLLAEVDDMATLRLLAREARGLALVPPVVVRDEIERGELVVTHRLPGLRETFYAITPSRRFPNPLVADLVTSARAKP